MPRILARVLEVAGLRSPGEAQFSSTEVTYRYWKALHLAEGHYPPTVIAFNRGFAAGEYPHLLA